MSDQSSNPILDAALQYAGRGWRVIPLHGIVDGVCTCKARAACPTPGKHPSIKTGRAFAGASTDAKLIHDWFRRANRNVGIATGRGLLVVDVDGPAGLATLRGIAERLPKTLLAQSGRPDGGMHLWFSCDSPAPTNSGGGLDCRGDGGLVVAPPSRHVSGQSYKWLNANPLARVPEALWNFLSQRKGGKRGDRLNPLGLPDYLRGSKRGRIAELATAGMHDPADSGDLAALAEVIPNPDCGWDEWNRIGMAFYAASDGSQEGLWAFKDWSFKSKKFDELATESRWRAYGNSPPTELSIGTLIYEAREAQPDFLLPSRTRQNEAVVDLKVNSNVLLEGIVSGATYGGLTPDAHPFAGPPHHADPPTTVQILNNFNSRYWVVNYAGKSVVMSWRHNPHFNTEEPEFSTFRAFTDFHCNRYVVDGNGETKPLAPYWLKWKYRKTFQAIDLIPEGPTPAGVFNLWRGFAVTPTPGKWPRMKAHIFNILGGANPTHAEYIVKWSAWAVQNPGKRAEAALVFRGGEGVGKGVFGNTMRQIFGPHGLAISSDKHLTGNFNAHFRSCLLLFSDEAFWPGHKAAEGKIKSLITEPTLSIEAKGFDLVDWPNRLHVIMSTNNDWVVPAARDARRYAVFDVVNPQQNEKEYFDPLYAELDNGGREAMLHDLLNLNLKGWHPRAIIKTAALQEQKELSFGPLEVWWTELVNDGLMPFARDSRGRIAASTLYTNATLDLSGYQKPNATQFGRFLKKIGGIKSHREYGNFWELPELNEARKTWEKLYGGWKWPNDLQKWQQKR